MRSQYTQTQCDEGARDGINIWYVGIISLGQGGWVHVLRGANPQKETFKIVSMCAIVDHF